MKKILTAIVLFAAVVGCHAAQRQALTLTMHQGAEIIYFLDTEPVISFEGQIMIVADGSVTDRIAMAGVKEWQIGMREQSSIAEAPEAPTIAIDGQSLRVFNPAGSPVSIYDIKGRTLFSASDTEASLTLPAGIYIVTIADKTYKIATR